MDLNITINDKKEIVKGYMVTFPEYPGFKFFTHCDQSGSYRYWHASEFTTGLKCAGTQQPGTKKEVIAKLKENINRIGIEELQKSINMGIEKYGIAN